MRIRLLLLASFVFFGMAAHAQEGTYEVIVKKQQEKQASRWSLADWLTQKQNNRLSDLVLAKNGHSSNFEFFLSGESYNYTTTIAGVQGNRDSYGGTTGFYIALVGVRGGYESDTENRTAWTGSANLRLLGKSLQDSNLNLEYGLRGLTLNAPATAPEFFQNQYAAVTVNLYLTKKFGLEGSYRKMLLAQSTLNRTLEGEQEQAGLFFEFGVLRLFANWRHEFLLYNAIGVPSSSEFRDGYGGGLRLYF